MKGKRLLVFGGIGAGLATAVLLLRSKSGEIEPPILSDLKTYDELNKAVNSVEWAVKYEADVFDCSEMSAYLKDVLDQRGFRTRLAVGVHPKYPNSLHAWLFVETIDEEWVPVEATNLTLISKEDIKSWRVLYLYSSIDAAMKDQNNPYEWDWWNDTRLLMKEK